MFLGAPGRGNHTEIVIYNVSSDKFSVYDQWKPDFHNNYKEFEDAHGTNPNIFYQLFKDVSVEKLYPVSD